MSHAAAPAPAQKSAARIDAVDWLRGFAVVLMIGIITSVFTAVNFTRMLVAGWVKRKRPRELHI